MNIGFNFKSIGSILIDRGLITQKSLKEGLEHQRITGLPLGQILINLGYIEEDDLLRALGI